ncbi:MAG: amidohydrolase family protein [Rhizobiaceae bacterium]|nr:amidohydrolase family protein [Rhizobiaceae bacterium]
MDSHQHFWKLSRGDYDWLTSDLAAIYRDFDPSDLKPHLDATGIDGTIILQAASSVAETEFMLSIADQHDWVLGVVGWIDMEADDASATLGRLAKNPKFVGIRSGMEGNPIENWVMRSSLSPAIKTLIDLDLTFDCLGKCWHVELFREFLGTYPDLRCIIDHCFKPKIAEGEFQPWADQIADIADNTNTLCKLSGLTTEAAKDWKTKDITPYANHVLKSFGPDRIVFGSDWPVVNLQSDYVEWVKLVETWIADFFRSRKSRHYGRQC